MLKINKPSQPLIPPTDVEGIEEIATSVASAAIASDTTHAPLVNKLVPAENLPSYVDDVLNFPSLAQFPNPGEEGKIYIANDTNNTYRWSGLEYVQVGGSEIDLTPYAKKAEVNAALAEKADITYVDAEVEGLEGDLAEKASSEDLAALATEVAAKANAAAVDEALALKANAADVESALDEKQDSISDLDTIRSGAADGAVAKTTTDNLTNNGNSPVYYIEHYTPSQMTNDEKALLQQVWTDFHYNNKQPRLYYLAEGCHECLLRYVNSRLYVLAPMIGITNNNYPNGISYYCFRVDNTGVSADNVHSVRCLSLYNPNATDISFYWDTTPTSDSTKPVTSGGIKTALDAKADASSVYTKSEVDSAIAAAIGDVLDQSF